MATVGGVPMTPEEIQAEKHYRYEERLGICCGAATTPTPSEIALAEKDAKEWEKSARTPLADSGPTWLTE